MSSGFSRVLQILIVNILSERKDYNNFVGEIQTNIGPDNYLKKSLYCLIFSIYFQVERAALKLRL